VYRYARGYLSKNYPGTYMYNIEQRVSMNGNNDFDVNDKFRLLAYSEQTAIIFLVQPQINKANLNKTLLKAIIGTFILRNPVKKNNKRYKVHDHYKGKKILICIVTINLNKPIFKCFDVSSVGSDIKEGLKKYMVSNFSRFHDDIYNAYCYNTKTNGKTLQTFINILKNKYPRLPPYIYRYFTQVWRKIKKNPAKHEKYLGSRESFTKHIGIELDNSIDDCLSVCS